MTSYTKLPQLTPKQKALNDRAKEIGLTCLPHPGGFRIARLSDNSLVERGLTFAEAEYVILSLENLKI